jgi:uncharacterized DUF497 family protein
LSWTWDPNKNDANKRKHKVGFEDAQHIFDDPLSITYDDPYPDEERFRTIGMVEGRLVLVIHTWTKHGNRTDAETGRIISARRPTRNEREAYEEPRY